MFLPSGRKIGDSLNTDSFTGIYREIAQAISPEVAIEIYNLFRGQQIIFPQRLYSQEFVIAYIEEHYDGHNVRELSHMFNYSDRRIRQIIQRLNNSDKIAQ